jgi:hypothetical protein
MQTAPRYDIYAIIHKGLRACFAQTQLDLGRLDWTDSDDVAAIMDRVQELLHLCRTHLAKENAFVHSAMESRRPGSAAAAGADHVHHERDIDALAAQAFTLRHLPALRREAAVHALYRELNRFIAENLAHMAMEESEHNRVLWDTHTDAEIKAIERAIVAAQAPEDARLTQRWMLTAMQPTERARFLAEIRDNAPAEAFAGMLQAARSLLSQREVEKLHAALGIARQPADYVGMA